jgi:putative membrane protein
MLKRSISRTALSLLLAAVSYAAWAKDTPGQQFITKAVQGNLAEVAMGQLAQQRASSDGVRSFGKTLEQDHSTANQQATAAASAVNASVPTEPNKKQKADHNRMAKLSGATFDREFVKHMVADHKKDISDYQKEAQRSDRQVSDYAKTTLPTLQKHLEIAQSLAKAGTPSQ